MAWMDSSSKILSKIPKDWQALVEKLRRLQQIGVALSAEHDLDRLLAFILKSARELVQADAGSVFVRYDDIEMDPRATGKDDIYKVKPYLALKCAQNDSVYFPFSEMRLPFDATTIAGYVATSGESLSIKDAYEIPKTAPFRHSTAFDQITGYRCRSMLVVPMQNREGEVIGVLQLINKKKDFAARLSGREEVEKQVLRFDDIDEELVISLGSQAAVSIENNQLYVQIKAMFRGFVDSLIRVLEHRNYTTFGHCKRIADYALALARQINLVAKEKGREPPFTEEMLEELEYGALLHDIGKMAVPDAVLDKRNKLTDDQLKIIEYRFALIRARGPVSPEMDEKLTRWLEAIRRINIPRGVSDEDAKILDEIRAFTFVDIDGKEKPLLDEYEYESLSVRRGNLTVSERKAIERHVSETWEILKRIPWTRPLRKVPNIAATHHERLDGSGYPWGLRGDEIPLGGKILAITDVFEALTAQDRPYKPAIPVDQAIQIIEEQVNKGQMDRELFDLFVKNKLYKVHINEETGRIKTDKK